MSHRQVQINAGQQMITRYAATRKPTPITRPLVQPVDTSRAAHAELVATVTDDVNWPLVGVERDDGGWLTRYEARSPEHVWAFGSTAMAEGERTATDRTRLPELLDFDVHAAKATLLVSPTVRYGCSRSKRPATRPASRPS